MEDPLHPRSLRDVLFGVASGIPAVGMTCRNRLPKGRRRKKGKSDVPTYFLGSSCRETAKNAIKQNRWEKTTGFFFLSTFSAKRF
jgi:hypothetical protein